MVQIENTGQKNVVLTVYELIEGEATISQGMLSRLVDKRMILIV
jgi:ESCRT-II complex subunit VPS25